MEPCDAQKENAVERIVSDCSVEKWENGSNVFESRIGNPS